MILEFGLGEPGQSLRMAVQQPFLKQLQILHLAFCVGVLMFMGVSAFLVFGETGPLGMDSDGSLIQKFTLVGVVLAVGGLAVAGLVGSQTFFKRLIEKARARDAVADKLAGYRTAFIVSIALLEGPALVAVVFFLVKGNPPFMALAAVLVGRMLMLRPTREKVVAALGLQYDEEAIS